MKKGQLVKAFVFALIATTLYAVGCARNQHKHAPVCPYGQVLTYDDTGYTCRFASVGYNNFNAYNQYNQYNNMNMNQNMYGNGASVVNAPIANCPISGQILVSWRGQWYCYFNDQIYPGGGDSPVGIIPPPGRGGEFCTSVGMSNYGTYGNNFNGFNNNGFNNNMYGSNMVMCSVGFQCMAQTTQVDPNNPQAWTGGNTGFGFGQSGTCQYNGYRGY